MKIPHFSNAPLKSLILAGSLLTAIPLAAAEVEIDYEEPRRFSDMGGNDSYTFSENTFERFQRVFQEEFQELADEYLPENAQLAVTFRDVDLAGEVEPWSRGTSQVRVLREVYPPRLKFHYQISGEDDADLGEGVAQLSDMNYLWGVQRIQREEPFYYERELLRDWARKTLADLNGSQGSSD